MKKNNRPYKYNSKSRLTSNSSFPFNSSSVKKLNESKKNLENTLTKFKPIDDKQLDKEILDNTFLESRVDKKNKKNNKKNTNNKNKKQSNFNSISFWKKFFLTLSIICAVILSILIMINTVIKYTNTSSSNNKSNIIIKKNKKIDDNYLFVGDHYIQDFPFKEFGLDYHYVKSSNSSLTTGKLLNNMKSMIYNFNPSIVFLEVGSIDLEYGVSEEEIINNYSNIIKLIKNNRPNAYICVISLIPNGNDNVVRVNSMIKELCNNEKVYYLDVYDLLNDSSYYNEEGLLNNIGYQELYKRIKSIIG